MANAMMRDFDPQLPTLSEIESATQFIRAHVPETPTRQWPLLNLSWNAELWLKHENLTPVGAFKIRGGLVYLDHLRRQQPNVKGVIAASTGNHGQSISFAAKLLGLKAVIVVPRGNNPEKMQLYEPSALNSWSTVPNSRMLWSILATCLRVKACMPCHRFTHGWFAVSLPMAWSFFAQFQNWMWCLCPSAWVQAFVD